MAAGVVDGVSYGLVDAAVQLMMEDAMALYSYPRRVDVAYP